MTTAQERLPKVPHSHRPLFCTLAANPYRSALVYSVGEQSQDASRPPHWCSQVRSLQHPPRSTIGHCQAESGGADSGGGLIVTGSADGGGFDVLSFTGTIDGGQPGPINAPGPDGFYFDNILYPALNSGAPGCAGGATLVDGCGILFQIGTGYGNIYDNFSGKGTGAYSLSVVSHPLTPATTSPSASRLPRSPQASSCSAPGCLASPGR